MQTLVSSDMPDRTAHPRIVAPGDGPPPHVHRKEDKAFCIMEGQFEVLCGGRLVTVGPGSFVYLPQDVPHTFKNVGAQTGRFLGMAVPARHEHFFQDADALVRSGTLTPETAAAVCRRHGMDLMV